MPPPFEVWIAVAAVYAGLSHFFLPTAGNTQLVQREFPWVAAAWSILYALGGAAMLIGLFRRSPRAEGFGLNLLAAGILVALVASLAAGAPILPSIIVQGGVTVACGARLIALRRLS
jgi:hypothetical protein